MKRFSLLILVPILLSISGFEIKKHEEENAWIRINLLGYKPNSPKVAVWCSKEQQTITSFYIIDVASGKTMYVGKAGIAFGTYGPFVQTYRLIFSALKQPGRYIIKAGNTSSPEFAIV